MPYTNQDSLNSAILDKFGMSLTIALGQLSGVTLFYGVFIILYFQSVSTYLKRRQRNQAHLWMFLATSVALILATLQEAALLANTGIFINSAFIKYRNVPLVERFPLVRKLIVVPDLINIWIPFLQTIISDGVVTWRVLVLLQDRKWLMVLPVLLLLGSAASLVADMIVNTISIVTDSLNRGSFGGDLNMAGVILSVATNVVATCTFAFIYWVHRKDMIQGLGKHQPNQGERVLALLVDSGVIYGLSQIAYFIVAFIPDPQTGDSLSAKHYIKWTFQFLFFGLSQIYPTAVMAIVNSHRTLGDMYLMDASLRVSSNGVDLNTTPVLEFSVPNHVTSAGTVAYGSQETGELFRGHTKY
ncbi:hypothetical protein BDZ94DRAFT_1309867 [Collybia nuda]|uniref:Uncharacterized protein n=1 Tax=Collybia nuda TaxID=64659 RepID=A0A9P5Y4R3_9AGAR|nr:hypothetical protein BDZ94DRAFT_1309867 [Collybia nuda]